MRAIVKAARGPAGTVLREVPRPQPVPGEAVIRVQAAAVCATDVHLRHDAFPCAMPVILGHEFTGVVEETGERVKGVAAGDRVVSENNPDACGACPACRDGYPNLCPDKRAIGFKRDGCFAPYLRVPASLLHQVPDNVPPAAAVLAEPLAVAVHAVQDRGGIEPGDTVAVLGPGAIGLLAAQVARAGGAGRVIVAGTDADTSQRLPKAEELGFETCNVQAEDLVERVRDTTHGHGVDVVVEASGAPPAVVTACDLVRRGGRIVVSGLTGAPEIAVPWDKLVAKAASVLFAFSSRHQNWALGLQYLAAGRVETETLVTDRFVPDDWQAAFDLMEHGGCIRAMLDFTA